MSLHMLIWRGFEQGLRGILCYTVLIRYRYGINSVRYRYRTVPVRYHYELYGVNGQITVIMTRGTRNYTRYGMVL